MVFMTNTGYQPTESEIIAIIRRMDIDSDQRVHFDEFCSAVEPTHRPIALPRPDYRSIEKRAEALLRHSSPKSSTIL